MKIIKKIKTDRKQICVDDIENPQFMFFGQYPPYDYKNMILLPYKNAAREITLFESNYIYVFRMRFKIIGTQWKGFFVIEEKDNTDYLQQNKFGDASLDFYNMPKFSANDFFSFIDAIQNGKLVPDSEGYFECNLRTCKRNTNIFVVYDEKDQ